MSIFDSVVLGIIQGLTEFLPISSSGHLVLVQELLGINEPGLTFELLSHLGTLGAILVYFRKTIVRLLGSLAAGGARGDRVLVGWLALGTIPVCLAGTVFEGFVNTAFASPMLTSAMLLVTGLILIAPRFIPQGGELVGWKSALAMGVGQAIAIMPGISRSGATIAAGLLTKVAPARAAEFSFLLAIPAISGAVILKADDVAQTGPGAVGPYIVGTLVAFLMGLVAVYLVLETIRRGKFEYFAYYCFAAGGLGLYLFV